MTRLLLLALLALSAGPLGALGGRLPAIPSAQRSAPEYGPEKAVDQDEATLWTSDAQPAMENNRVWFQLDLGSVRPVARLHWLAAGGTPYPASAPAEYRVLVSSDGAHWRPIPTAARGVETAGDVLLNADARYVRLETTKVNDGSGWALGLKEIWVTGGRDQSAVTRALRPRCTARDGAVRLEWSAPEGVDPAGFLLYRVDAPGASPGQPLAKGDRQLRSYVDKVPNWQPHYYWVEAVDAAGKTLLKSDLAAAFARPAEGATAPVETFAFWYQSYLPSTDANPSIKQIGDAAFVVGPGFSAAADLAKLGKGLLPYVTFYQTADWVPTARHDADPEKVAAAIAPVAFYRKSLRFQNSPPGYAPSIFCRPGNVEYNARAVQYTTCPNSTPFREMILKRVRAQLEGGVRGFFVDNGYEDDVASHGPCEATAHPHTYGNHLTGADAFLGILMEVTCEVKKRHPNGVVMVNGGVPARSDFYGLRLGDVCDGQLWESYLRSSYHTAKEHVYDWQSVYRQSVGYEKAWHVVPPRRMFVLSYPWDRREAYLCYCTAKLCALPWSACLGTSDPEHKHFGGHFGTYPELVDLRLGRPADERQYGGTKRGEIYTREYERGLVAVNPGTAPQKVAVPLGKMRRYRDVFAGQEGEGDTLTVELPAESGRAYVWQ